MLDSSDLRTRLAGAVARASGQSSDFDLNPGIRLPEGRRLRPAAVLMLVGAGPAGAAVYLTKRASHLKHHPGQIAFPGGKQDDGDPDLTATALREAEEEIALPGGQVDVIGHLPAHETVTGFLVTPVLGLLRSDFAPVPHRGEVDEVFTAPLDYLMQPAHFQVQKRRWRGVWRAYQTIPFGPYYIWGATARMLYGFSRAMTSA